MEVARIRWVLAALAAGAFALGGCGGADAPDGGEATAAGSPSGETTTPEAEPVADEPTRPAKPETLELIDGGSPTVWVQVGEQVDLYDEPGGDVVETVGARTDFGSRTVFAVSEQRGDWVAVPTAYVENGAPLWVKLDPEKLRAGRVTWEIVVDLSDYQASLFSDGKLVRTFAVSIGKPDAPTPTGRFAVTDTFRGGLNAAYGCCALALTARQTNLPSGWLGGDRIAIHGTTGPLNAAISHGCVRAADADVSDLVDKIPPGTPVEIRQ